MFAGMVCSTLDPSIDNISQDISVRVAPSRGSAFWFFTLDDQGRYDGSSWHGGAAVGGDLGMLGMKVNQMNFIDFLWWDCCWISC